MYPGIGKKLTSDMQIIYNNNVDITGLFREQLIKPSKFCSEQSRREAKNLHQTRI